MHACVLMVGRMREAQIGITGYTPLPYQYVCNQAMLIGMYSLPCSPSTEDKAHASAMRWLASFVFTLPS